MNGNSTRRLRIEAGGEGVVAHVGLHALGAFADRLGLGDTLSAAVMPAGERLPVHDRGKVLVQAMLMAAGGGECCADIEHLRAQPELFGAVPSDSTLYRTFRRIDPATRGRLWDAIAEVRARVWRRAQLPERLAAGHRAGDDPALVRRPVQVRVDSAGCTRFVWHARARNAGFAVVARSNQAIHTALSRVAYEFGNGVVHLRYARR